MQARQDFIEHPMNNPWHNNEHSWQTQWYVCWQAAQGNQGRQHMYTHAQAHAHVHVFAFVWSGIATIAIQNTKASHFAMCCSQWSTQFTTYVRYCLTSFMMAKKLMQCYQIEGRDHCHLKQNDKPMSFTRIGNLWKFHWLQNIWQQTAWCKMS